jgi:hypothetical protein
VSIEKNMVAYGSETWVHTYDTCVIWERHGMVSMLLTGCTICVCQYWTYKHGQMGCFWLGVDRQGHRSSKGVDYDILTQDLIGLIEYPYHKSIPSFLQVQLQRTLGSSVFDLDKFQDG